MIDSVTRPDRITTTDTIAYIIDIVSRVSTNKLSDSTITTY